ncbi:MAG: HNH endonuclease domain-containing protein [Pirellulaceae bacterium]|nr:hypothetical protein [Planctomycetaceae bacterium]MDP6722380.1 HNH endonuclease domain-containing protein [Pirellulaceae bacterium]
MPGKATVTAKMIMELIESQDFRCALSNRELTPETASLDHVVPLSRGGTHEVSNLCVVVHLVNSAKGSMTVEEFVAMCQDVATCQSGPASTVPA